MWKEKLTSIDEHNAVCGIVRVGDDPSPASLTNVETSVGLREARVPLKVE